MDEGRDELHHAFVKFSREKLKDEYWPRICRCLDSLTEEQIWWRPNETSNSVGNLLLHLNGNMRQWILAPLGGIANTRDRDAEFAERATGHCYATERPGSNAERVRPYPVRLNRVRFAQDLHHPAI